MFVTSVLRDGSSASIGDYNDFVDNAAAAGAQLGSLNVTWRAIASTPTVSAIDNIGGLSGVPIYLLDGTFVASGVADLFDGDIDASIYLDENGNASGNNLVLTGTSADGSACCSSELGSSSPLWGLVLGDTYQWLTVASTVPSTLGQFYGISDAITATPEPRTLGSVLAAVVVLGAMRRRRRG